MKTLRIFFVRLLLGLLVLAVTLAASFATALAQIPSWGATAQEVARPMPGDELAPAPQLNWTNAIDINAAPAQVWPWIAQMGDERAGFYSYTFIENRIGSLMGASDYTVHYVNANQIVAEWQNPAPGDSFIQGSQKIHAVVPGNYLLAEAVNPEIFQWIWVWQLFPQQDGTTRLLVRFRIQLPQQADNPVLTTIMSAGGFVMQQRMLHGLKLRAEGGSEPAWIELLEIGLWVSTLLIGLIAGLLYLLRREWQKPLALAVAAVVFLVALSFIQPAIWIRVVINLLLLVGLWWAWTPTVEAQTRSVSPEPVGDLHG